MCAHEYICQPVDYTQGVHGRVIQMFSSELGRTQLLSHCHPLSSLTTNAEGLAEGKGKEEGLVVGGTSLAGAAAGSAEEAAGRMRRLGHRKCRCCPSMYIHRRLVFFVSCLLFFGILAAFSCESPSDPRPLGYLSSVRSGFYTNLLRKRY